MISNYEDLKNWYNSLKEGQKLELWQRFSSYLNDSEIKKCMFEVKKGRADLFEIHYKNGYIVKYQIYFYQIMEKLDAGD